jgi:hypothetical protein
MANFCFSGSQRQFIKNRLGPQIFRKPKMMALAFFMGLFSLFSAEECYSQTGKPPVSVTVIFAKETVVCAPDGYASNYENQNKKRQCNPLYYGKLEELGITVAHQLPPEKIPLKDLFRLIDWYSEKCTLELPCKDPEERYAIVLAFEFQMQPAKGVEVSLKRQVPEDIRSHFGEDPDVGEYAAYGVLDEGGHWINHQRADLFLPGYGVEWILTAGEHSWALLTTK